MPLMFYPHEDDVSANSLDEKLEILMEAAERYKAVVLDVGTYRKLEKDSRLTPLHMTAAYNWEEIAKVLREIRELPEATHTNRIVKATKLMKLAEIYEVLRSAKMPKLEAVRLALVNEATQLQAQE